MADSEVCALKEALCNQYIMMKKLYDELEEEREASSTAASEALSMILRLQREKAAEKMESSQYRRIADEKIHHAEERLEFLEEVIQQNEMEITSLHYQVETYKQKLARHGVNIPDVGQMSTEEQPINGSNVHKDKTSFHGFIRRNISLPSLFQLDQFSSERDTTNDESRIEESDSPVWKQADELNRKLKELMQAKNAKEVYCSNVPTTEFLRPLSVGSMISDQEFGSFPWYLAVSAGASIDSTTGGMRKKSDDQAISCLPSHVRDLESVTKVDGHSSHSETESNGNSVHPAGVHDIFEIPESHKAYNSNQPYKQVSEESVHGANMLGMLSHMPQESGDNIFRGDDWLNKAFVGQYGNKSSPAKKPPNLPRRNKLSTPSKGTPLGYHGTLGDHKVDFGSSQVDFEQLKLHLKQLQTERIVMQENTERNKEQLLLKNIFKQLNTIETHLQKSTTKKFDVNNDSKVVSVMEAILSFSI